MKKQGRLFRPELKDVVPLAGIHKRLKVLSKSAKEKSMVDPKGKKKRCSLTREQRSRVTAKIMQLHYEKDLKNLTNADVYSHIQSKLAFEVSFDAMLTVLQDLKAEGIETRLARHERPKDAIKDGRKREYDAFLDTLVDRVTKHCRDVKDAVRVSDANQERRHREMMDVLIAIKQLLQDTEGGMTQS